MLGINHRKFENLFTVNTEIVSQFSYSKMVHVAMTVTQRITHNHIPQEL